MQISKELFLIKMEELSRQRIHELESLLSQNILGINAPLAEGTLDVNNLSLK